jgi:mono/diheme cytochrome c family protein
MSSASLRLLLASILLAGASSSSAAPPAALEILRQNCLQCHNEHLALSGLNLASREGALKGGSRGPALVPGQAEKSRLYLAAAHAVTPGMPPGRKLSEAELQALKTWIDAGAPWEEAVKAPAALWWSFRKPVRPMPPAVQSSWVRNPIDAFILAKLGENNLRPAPEADRATLIRRLYFDLHGLPPTYEEVQAFIQDQSPDAYEKLIDRLLASPRYGEKWARYWLDLVRYSDTAGFELDSYIADAWRYRDWVIQSLNEDKPYDRFLKEQLAADEFYPEDTTANIGTGYFCVGPNRDLFPDQADINRVETLTDYVDTTGSVFLGLTIGCARCHDHKYDPIPQRDYYRLQAIFAPGVKTRVALSRLGSLAWDVTENVREIKLREIGEQIGAIQDRCRRKLFEEKIAALPAEVQEALRLDDAQRNEKQRELATQYGDKARVSEEEIRSCLSPDERERLGAIERKLVAMFATYRSKPFACGFTDVGDYAPKTYVPLKGNPKGMEVKPGLLYVLGGSDIPEQSFERPVTGPIPLFPTTGRRKALAEWLASPEHPLTARVMVNRIWQYHFGRGIVATPSDFGARGARPTHPELLDWLATEFVARGWSIKQMHKLILTSSTYRQSAQPSPEAQAKDPDNTLLSHFRRRRLMAEEIRDGILMVSGSLNLKMGGRPVVPPLTEEEQRNLIGKPEDAWVVTADEREHNRRSIYLFQRRTFRVPLMEVFDQPESMLSCPRREHSTAPPQSLTLMNSTFAMQQARMLARRLVGEKTDTEAVRAAWRLVLARDPKAAEEADAREFLAAQSVSLGSREAALAELARALFNLNEFLYVE